MKALAVAKRMARSLENIRAVDYGYAYKDGKLTDKVSIRFHMERKRRLSTLPRDQRLPASIEGIEVDVLDTAYMLHAGSPRGMQQLLQPGLSIGSLKLKTTGTLGAFVRDLSNQDVYILSNWHVLCGGPESAVGDPISQPGPMDLGSKPAREVARLERWLRLSEQFDAAVARLSQGATMSGELFGTNLKRLSIGAPVLGMKALKCGAVSGLTYAMIDGVVGSYRLDYTGFGDGPQWMDGFRLVPDPQELMKSISEEGDSGALWVDREGTRAIGLHFAGEDATSPLNDYAVAHPISDVCSRLNVELIAP